MRQVVRDTFPAYTESFESLTDFLYDDIKGIPTFDAGIVLTLGMALSLPWVRTDGTPATHDDIEEAWAVITSPAALATDKQGGAHYATLTHIRCTRAGLLSAFSGTLARFEAQLKTFLPNWEDSPANSQFAALSHAWAFGGLFPQTWPSWTKAFKVGDWECCASEDVPNAAEMAAQNPSFHRRIATEQALLNAARNADPDTIGWTP